MPENLKRFSNLHLHLGLAIGILSVSTGSIFIRYAQLEASSLTIAAYRMGIAFCVVLLPTLLFERRGLSSLTKVDFRLALLSGCFLAVHFATWIYSLEYTSVAISVVMVNTAPLWVALFTPLVTSDRISRTMAVAVGISISGVAVIGSGFDGHLNASDNFIGTTLATLGGIGLAGYLLVGRELRLRHSLGVYATVCYGSAALLLWTVVILARQQLTGFTSATWWSLIGVALISQVMGHSLNNWALRFLSSSAVAVALLGEPVISSVLAYFLFEESLSAVQVLGALLVLLGIYLAVRTERGISEEER